VLHVEPIVGIDLLEVANGLGSAGVGVTEQKRREGAAAHKARVTRDAGLKEAETGPAAVVLLAEAVRLLAVIGEPGFHVVRSPDQRDVVLHGRAWLLRPVIRNGAPRREL